MITRVPESSMYVIESRSLSRQIGQSYMLYLMFITRLQMAIYTLLNSHCEHSDEHNFFQVKDAFMIKEYDLRVGGERVSSQRVVNKLACNDSDGVINIPDHLLSKYQRLNADVIRERYANCLLLSLGISQRVQEKNRQSRDE